MHANDTFGTSMQQGISAVLPKFDMPYKIVEQISYDPTARDLSVEVAKAKATGADALLMVSRLNDAILLTRELIKQRWSPMAVLSMGPGWYEEQYLKTLGKMSDGPLSFVPWYDPHKKLTKQLEDALAKAYPGINLNTNHVYTFEALLVAADAFKRARSTDPKALADAIRATNITDNVSIGPGIQFNEKGQNDKLKNAAIQNRGGKLLTVAPKGASNAKAELPMTAYDKRS
jgi:branched-chain amino acid transport system substrate-binding protein